MLKQIAILACLAFSFTLSGQNNVKADAPKIFIDCQTWCQMRYLKQELNYVYHMLDRQNADVFIQITSLETGSGGDQYIIETKGQDRFLGLSDTLQYNLEPNISDNVQREKMLENIEKALLPFLLKTSLAENITFSIAKGATNEKLIDDPWKSWVFNIGCNFNLNGQQVAKYTNLNGRISASKVTENVKIEPRVYYGLNRSKFTFEDEEDEVYNITNSGASLKYVKSISEHFSAGFFTELSESSFSNYLLSFSFQPAIEYNIYPYQEANKRQLSALYRIGPNFNNYVDSTIFDQKKEWLYRQSLSINFTKIEDWGSFDIDFTTGNYLHDWNLFFARIQPWIELNLIKGLRLNLGGSFSLIRNQINIPKGNATREDVLLQLQQLQSNYNYYGWMGINYRFGSTYNNIVNNRFF